MTKYQQYFQDMLKQNKQLFDQFQIIHDKFAIDPKNYKSEFDNLGRQVQDVLRRTENRLCGHSEGSGYSKFSANLAEKFHQEVKKQFPKIDQIGME